MIKKMNWMLSQEYENHNRVFKKLFPDGKYNWFSGLIRIDDFRGKYDDENNEDGIYELLEIRDGNFITHWKLNFEDFHEFKKIIFANFKTTKEYEKLFLLWKNNNPGITATKIDEYIFQKIVRHVRKI